MIKFEEETNTSVQYNEEFVKSDVRYTQVLLYESFIVKKKKKKKTEIRSIYQGIR